MEQRDRPDRGILLWKALKDSGVGRTFMLLNIEEDGTAFIEGEVNLREAAEAYLRLVRGEVAS